MPTIPHPTQGVTKCSRCGAPIRWASGPDRGQRTPLNAMPSPAGNLAARATGLGGTVVRRLDAEEPEPVDALLEWKALAHFNSCTGQQPPAPAPGPRPARRRPTVQPPLFGQAQGRRTR